uniref:Uncharacterized protein n=1 Tax=Octopus bimaculoides TaxID=37653 RepID=A0A0L8FSB6_OCTBM
MCFLSCVNMFVFSQRALYIERFATDVTTILHHVEGMLCHRYDSNMVFLLYVHVCGQSDADFELPQISQ